jgi:hypothetical protein
MKKKAEGVRERHAAVVDKTLRGRRRRRRRRRRGRSCCYR